MHPKKELKKTVSSTIDLMHHARIIAEKITEDESLATSIAFINKALLDLKFKLHEKFPNNEGSD